MKTIDHHSEKKQNAVFCVKDIIPAAVIADYLSNRDSQTDGIWMPQKGYTREQLIVRRAQGLTTYYYKITRRCLSVWARHDFDGTPGSFLNHHKGVYRWQLADYDEVCAKLEAMPWDGNHPNIDFFGLPMSEIFAHFSDLAFFVSPCTAPVAAVEEVAAAEPVAEETTAEETTEAPAMECVRNEAVADETEATETESIEAAPAADENEIRYTADDIAEREAEIEKWRRLYEHAIGERNAAADDDTEDDRATAAPKAKIGFACLWADDKALSFLSGLRMVHYEWALVIACLYSFFVLLEAIADISICFADFWYLSPIVLLQISVMCRNKEAWK